MILTLEVVASPGAKLGAAGRKQFRASGGTIGREKNSDWVLPHTKVSGRHALISCVNAVFYIEDTSTNGVFLNSPTNRLERGRKYALESGDRILIDPYDIDVLITAEQDEAFRPPIAGRADPRSPAAFPPPSSSTFEPAGEAIAGEELDPLKLLDPAPKRPPVRKAPSARDLDHGSPLDGHYKPPAVRPAPAPVQPPSSAPVIPPGYDPLAAIPAGYDPLAPIPPDYDPLSPDNSFDATLAAPLAPPPAERPATPAAEHPAAPDPPAKPRTQTPVPIAVVNPPAAVDELVEPSQETLQTAKSDVGGGSDLSDMLTGAGLDGIAVTPELARSFGEIFRVVVAGVMDILQSRHQIKDEFRMRMTRFKVADNNPLKFSANVDDALHNLLIKRNEAYLDPIEAFEDAFDDLRDHQLAMLAGMRVAFESMLAAFDPDHLQEQFDRQIKRGSLLGMPAKLRYWDLYRDARQDMVKDPEGTFRRLFGEEFAKAYEEQLKRLKTERLAGKK